MANFVIPENPGFSLAIRKFETTDRGHADVFNPVFQKMIENEAYLLEHGGISEDEVAKIVDGKIGDSNLNAPGKPDIISSMSMLGGNNLISGTKVKDASAQYDVIESSTASVGQIFSSSISVPKGLYSVMLRAKVSDVSSAENIFKLEIKDGTDTTVKYIRPQMFKTANKFTTLGCVVECNSGAITVALSVNKALAGQTIRVDYIAVAPTMTSITSIG